MSSLTARASAADSLADPNSIAPLPAQQTKPNIHEQCVQPPDPLHFSGNDVSMGWCDGSNINKTSRMATGDTAEQFIQETQGSISRSDEQINAGGFGSIYTLSTLLHRLLFMSYLGPRYTIMLFLVKATLRNSLGSMFTAILDTFVTKIVFGQLCLGSCVWAVVFGQLYSCNYVHANMSTQIRPNYGLRKVELRHPWLCPPFHGC